MSTISPIHFKTKSGRSAIIRSAVPADADGILSACREVMTEELYTLTTAEEFNMTTEQESKWIEEMTANPSKLALVVEVDSKVVGMLDFSPGHRKRIAHTGEFGMSITKPYREDGIGKHFLQALLTWCVAHPVIEKVQLRVHSTNFRAIALYEKLGFIKEGLLIKEMKYKGVYADTIVMAKFVK